MAEQNDSRNPRAETKRFLVGRALALPLCSFLAACTSGEDTQPASSASTPAREEPAASAQGFRLSGPVEDLLKDTRPSLDRSHFESESLARSSGTEEAKHLLLLVRTNGEQFDVLQAKEVAEPLARPRHGISAKPWEVRARDQGGHLLFAAPLADPKQLHGEFRPSDPEGSTEEVRVEMESAVFAVRVPLNSRGIDFVERSPLARSPAGAPPLPAKIAAPTLPGETLLGRTQIPMDQIERL